MHRREFIVLGASGILATSLRRRQSDIEAIEKSVGGRLGFMARELEGGAMLTWRADERFPMCSTFKWLLVARVLARVDDGHEELARSIHYTEADLLEYAPITRAHVNEGHMSVSDLCAAAIQYSDNTAANLLLATIGGPGGLTRWLRSIGDRVTRLDRNEPGLNTSIPGDERDTTTPRAMTRDLGVLLPDVGVLHSSRRLVDWMIGNTTGNARLRAGLPPDWHVADKTGTGANGSTNDVAIAWPGNGEGPAVVMAAYLTETTAPDDARSQALAELGRLVGRWAR